MHMTINDVAGGRVYHALYAMPLMCYILVSGILKQINKTFNLS